MYSHRSVSSKIAYYLFVIIILAGVVSVLSFVIMESNKFDAKSVNMAGSLRMQSYRILHDMRNHPFAIGQNLQQYDRHLNSPLLRSINEHFCVSKGVKQSYQRVTARWAVMKEYARQGNKVAYTMMLGDYIQDLDSFVFELQQFSEKKWIIGSSALFVAMLLIIGVVFYLIWFAHKEVVEPLKMLTQASIQVQMGQFKHIPLDTHRNNELGSLARSFTQMSTELSKLYSHLEDNLNEKTQRINQTNRSLTALYNSSQMITSHKIDQNTFNNVLQQIKVSENLRYIELQIYGLEHWNVQLGETFPNQNIQREALNIENEQLGYLYWQAGLPCPDPRIMKSLAQMLARALFFYQNQCQREQLLLMEERSVIARELHDSLAQVLSFLQIQLTLLKHNLNKDCQQAKQKNASIIADFEQALSSGYSQLRELLATFRLTVEEAHLQIALEKVIDSVRSQTSMRIRVDSSLPSHSLNPQQLVHVLQIVRESVLNAIKHSQGKNIDVIAHTNIDGEYEILILDDGLGIPSLQEPEGHYGLNIMQERAQQLNATLQISRRKTGGTEVKIILPQPFLSN